ncbi:GtrA family protein [Candidatus Saganbacteria bacterium]|nr:GtrA family protein [Candidatus Saganbacteria bacterium]
MRQLYKRHQEKINYLLVGIWNTVFGYLTFVGLYCLLSVKIHYLFLLVISNVFSITNAYIGYKIFVFKTRGNYWQEYLRFYLVYGAALAVNFALLPIGVELLKISPPWALAGLTVINVIFSYYGHKKFSFRSAND